MRIGSTGAARALTAVTAVVALLAGAIAGGPAAAAGTPAWTHAGYGPGNTGYNAAESVVNSSTVKKLRLRWRVQPVPGTEGCAWQTTPVVADGRMFVVDGDGVGAYSVTTGKLLWRDTTVMDSRVGRTMTVTGGLVITTGWSCYGVSNPSGHMTALDVRTGAVRWHVMENQAIETVVADAGTIVTYSRCDICESDVVTGYRASDGAEQWRYDEATLTSPVISGGRVLLTGVEGGSFAVSATTGAILWRSGVDRTALAADPAGTRFHTTDPAGTLTTINAATGKVLWSVRTAAGPLATDGRRVYVSRAGIAAYDATTGRRLWKRAGVPESRPVRAGGLLYVTGSVLSPVNGSLILSATYSSAYHHAFVVAGKVLRVKGMEIQAYGA